MVGRRARKSMSGAADDSTTKFPISGKVPLEWLMHRVTDRTLGAMSSAPKGALAATSISQEVQPTIRTHGAEAQHATSTYGVARDAICSLLGQHPGFRPGPPPGAPEASTTDMATGSPIQCTSF
ncbi:hypothetical protein V6N13_080977 [Hibiscus sabdariffa]